MKQEKMNKEKFEAMCIEAIKSAKISITDVPKNLRTNAMYFEWVKQNPGKIGQVPKKMITEEMCDYAITHSLAAIEGIPAEFQTAKFFLKHAQKQPSILRFVPDYFDEKFYKYAVQTNVRALEYVPQKYQTYDVLSEAVRSFGMALVYIPEKKRDMTLCQTAVFSDPKVAKYVPAAIKNTKEWKEFSEKFIAERRKEILEKQERQKKMDEAYEIYKNLF